jgi:TP901 family phage tail tape measure protein
LADTVRATLQYDANFGPAIAQSRILASEVGKLNAQFNAFDAASQNLKKGLADTFRAGVGSVNGYTSKMVDMQTQTDIFSKRLQQNKLTMREYFSEAYRGVTRQNSMMRTFARDQLRFQQAIIAPTGVSVGGKQQGIAFIPDAAVITNSAEKMKLLSNEFNTFRHLVRSGATEMINFGKNTQWTGRQLTVGLTMPIVLFGSTIAKVFMDVDKELTRFAKVYGGDLTANTTEATNLMKDQVLSLAKTISEQFGVAAKETAALAADIAATGQEGQKLIDTVSQTTRLSVLGDVDRTEAMKATLAMQSAFKLNTDDLAESINFLNAVENQTSTSLNDLVEAIPKAGPVVKGLGGSIKDLSVLMVAMREGGIPASEAANAIKSGMASLINPTQKASEVAKKFGVDLNAIVDANQGKFMPTIFAMQEALNGLDQFAKSKVIEEIFGKYQFARMTALFNNIGTAGSQSTKVLELANASVDQLASTANQELNRLTESATVKFA